MAEFAVEMKDVVKQFPAPGGGEITAVNHVTLQIKQGEFFSLLGSSGCGKTTSLRMIAGFELPTSGEVYVHGQPMGNTPPYTRPVNTVFQNYALFQHMTIAQNVAFGLEMEHRPKDEIKQRVQEALDMVQLGGYGSRKPKQLSGGQQQRVALARALVKRPSVLLLDEPLGALDLKLRKEMQLELKSLQSQVGITFVYVTHDQEEALTMSDRIAVMSKGIVAQLGTPIEIYERPQSRFVADFIGETNFLEGSVEEQHGKTVIVKVGEGLTVRAESENALSKGSGVTVAVRPEKVHLFTNGTAPAQEMNIFRGRMAEVIYIGTDTHYSVLFANGQKVRVRGQNADPISRPMAQTDDEVTIAFAQNAARVLTE